MSRVIIDIEANSLIKPTKIWLAVCKDIDTNHLSIFRNLHESEEDITAFVDFSSTITLLVGHNILEYDIPVLLSVVPRTQVNLGRILVQGSVWDTLILSRMVEYTRPMGHSLGSYGEEIGLPKFEFNDWTQWSQNMEDYCVRDVDITHKVYDRYSRVLDDQNWLPSIRMEHRFQHVVNVLHSNGFAFNGDRAGKLLSDVKSSLSEIDEKILIHFPPRLKLVKLVEPRRTKHGTLNRNDFRWVENGDISDYNGYPFCKCSWVDFNLDSPRQIVSVLNRAGWRPVVKTTTHIDVEQQINRLKYSHNAEKDLTLKELTDKLSKLKETGWKINEENLNTLPDTAPEPARLLAKRILYESRRRTLTEWLSLVGEDNRIHGKFVGIGAWTHRMAHQRPNLANIPNATKEDGSTKLLGKELRSLWKAPRNRLLVGVDAEGIQLRIFAHYINDKEFINALVSGRKSDKTDPHSLNGIILGCPRQQAKRFIYAWLLGAGNDKLAQILGTNRQEATEALSRLYDRYSGLAHLKREIIPSDAKRGWFKGLDGRKVVLPGDTPGTRAHLCMSGYLQNGEAIIMKMACLKWHDALVKEEALLVNFVHDEWQTETPNNMEIALRIANIQAESLRLTGEELGLNCPLAGSYYNDDKKDYTIGTNWYQTH
jgi:DNA polymerase I